MKKNRVLKLFILNSSIMFANILVFSRAFFGVVLGSGALATSFGIMTIVMSTIAFFYGNIKLLSKKPAPPLPTLKDKDINTLDSCAAAVEMYIANNAKIYADNLKTILTQIDRMKRRKQTIKDILLEKFCENELTYGKFASTVSQIEQIMILNIKSLLNRLNAFDEEEYEKMLSGANAPSHARPNRLEETRLSIYNEYKAFVFKSTENNEEILLKLDKLILEISKLNTLNVENIEELDAVIEIDSLIRDAKWYR